VGGFKVQLFLQQQFISTRKRFIQNRVARSDHVIISCTVCAIERTVNQCRSNETTDLKDWRAEKSLRQFCSDKVDFYLRNVVQLARWIPRVVHAVMEHVLGLNGEKAAESANMI
jgi:hypothetical protein